MDGKPIAALVDARIFERIRGMQARFDVLSQRIEAGYAAVSEAEGLAQNRRGRRRNPRRALTVPTLRAVLDTKVLLSGIAYPSRLPGRLIAAWKHGALEVVLCGYILDELRRVLPKLAHRHGPGANEVDDPIDALAIQAELVEPEIAGVPGVTDANDLPALGPLIATRQGGQVSVLITGDKALLALTDRYPIRTPAEPWSSHGGV